MRLVIYKHAGESMLIHDFPASQWPAIEKFLKDEGIKWYVVSY
tara:strand:+ start:311 stop:439 length:129 start_codon:yes stop_codon:yes gene_type:complete